MLRELAYVTGEVIPLTHFLPWECTSYLALGLLLYFWVSLWWEATDLKDEAQTAIIWTIAWPWVAALFLAMYIRAIGRVIRTFAGK